MKSPEEIKKVTSDLPDTPGVYLFKHGSEILYIGKATSLRDRVRSYFRADIVETRSPLITKMLNEFDLIEHIKTDSVLEALVLEAHLIKKHQPTANTLEKDDKSFNFVVITKDPERNNDRKRSVSYGTGDFPRVLVLRGRELLNSHYLKEKQYEIAYSFGPFVNGSQLKEAMKIVRKMFPFRDKCEPFSGKRLSESDGSAEVSRPNVPCFNRQIGLCPGVCTGEITQKEYAKQIKNIILFFEGNKKKLIKSLETQMKDFAKLKQFENAEKVKKTIFILNHIQDISLIKEDIAHGKGISDGFRIESYDIAHMSGQNVVGVMTVVENGEINKSEYRKFKIKEDPGVNDTKALSEILERRLAHIEWRLPNLIVVDGALAQRRVMEKVLKNNGLQIPVVSVVKDERHKAREIQGDKKWLKYEREIVLSNSEAHRYAIAFHRSLRGKIA